MPLGVDLKRTAFVDFSGALSGGKFFFHGQGECPVRLNKKTLENIMVRGDDPEILTIETEHETFGIVVDGNALDLFKTEFNKITVDLFLVWMRTGSKKKD